MIDMKKLFLGVLASVMLLGCSHRSYVVVQVADAQLGFAAADLSVRTGEPYVNDLSYESDCLKRAVAVINGLCPDVVVFTGDQVNDPSDEEQWSQFEDIIADISADIKVFHLPGNHDVIFRDGKVDASSFAERYGYDRFVQCDKGVRLVGLNTNFIKSDDASEMEQIEWMKEALTKENPEEVTLVFGHHPFFMTEIDEPDSYFPIMTAKRLQYFDIFSEFDVDAVYAGHRHETYEAEYAGIPMRTTTSVAFQLGSSKPSIRVITIKDGEIFDEMSAI